MAHYEGYKSAVPTDNSAQILALMQKNQQENNVGKLFERLGTVAGEVGTMQDTSRAAQVRALLAGARNPEEAEAMKAQVAGLQANIFGERISRELGKEVSARPTELMQQVTAENLYKDQQGDLSTRALRSEIGALQISDNPQDRLRAVELMKTLTDPRYQLIAQESANKEFQRRATENRAITAASDKSTMDIAQAANWEASAINARGMLANAEQQTLLAKKIANENFQMKQEEARSKTSLQLAEASKNSAGSELGRKAIMDSMASVIEDKDILGKVGSKFSEAMLYKKGYSDLPTDVVQAIMMKQQKSIGGWYNLGRWGSISDITDDLDQALIDNEDRIGALAVTKSRLTETALKQDLKLQYGIEEGDPKFAAVYKNFKEKIKDSDNQVRQVKIDNLAYDKRKEAERKSRTSIIGTLRPQGIVPEDEDINYGN